MRLTDDISSAKLIFWKGWLFFVLGLLAGTSLLALYFSWQVALLLAVTIWSFCRWYYFMFYVIEHYVDPGYKFDGITSFVRYMLTQRK